MKNHLIIFISVFMFLMMSNWAMAQGVPVGEDEIVELDVTEIKVTIETPQVRLFSDRIKPEFDDVHLQKSFIREITGEGERFVFESITSREAIRIDLDQIVNKGR